MSPVAGLASGVMPARCLLGLAGIFHLAAIRPVPPTTTDGPKGPKGRENRFFEKNINFDSQFKETGQMVVTSFSGAKSFVF